MDLFLSGEINKDTYKYLTPSNPRTARFYHLPKIHKAGNPGRPIVSSCGAPMERIGICWPSFEAARPTDPIVPTGHYRLLAETVENRKPPAELHLGNCRCKNVLFQRWRFQDESWRTEVLPYDSRLQWISYGLTDPSSSLSHSRGGFRTQTLSWVPQVVTFHPGLTRLNRILKKRQPILKTFERLQGAIPDLPLISFRRPPKLRDMLVRAQLKTPAPSTNTGNAPCGSRRCKTCTHIMHTKNTQDQGKFYLQDQEHCAHDSVPKNVECSMLARRLMLCISVSMAIALTWRPRNWTNP